VTVNDVAIRLAVVADASVVARIWFEGWHDGHDGRVPAALARARTEDSFYQRAAERVADTRVAVVDESVAGFVMVTADEVEQVYVDRAFRGTAVATALLAAAESWILEAGHRSAWLAVVDGNERARRFYRRCGWIDEGPLDYQAAAGGGTIVVPCRRYVKQLA
jgi:GNAT superfamily N-acetyltransferase